MKKTITTFFMLLCTFFAFAQDEAVNTNKWIETYEGLNASKDWNSMLSQAATCKAEVPNWEFVHYYEGLANFNLKYYQDAIIHSTNSSKKTQQHLLHTFTELILI